MEEHLVITLFPGYYYKLGPPPKIREYNYIVGPLCQGDTAFILYFDQRSKGKLNEIATSLLGSREKVHGEALISHSRGFCKDADLVIFGEMLKKYLG